MGIHTSPLETSLSGYRRNGFAFLALLFLILVLYSNTFYSSWHFDDQNNILKNRALHITELNWPRIKNTFYATPDGMGKLYRPVACLSFALNYYLGRENVLGYHVVNIAIHFFASLSLFLFIFHTLNLPLLKAGYGPNAYSIALLSSILWSINPVQTQAVTYIVQRMASMAGMFYIMAMYFYLKGRTSEKVLSKATHFFLCLLCGILAFGTKENAAMLPFSILLFDLFLIQKLTKENIKKTSIILLFLILIPLILALVFNGLSIFHPKNLFSGYDQRAFTLLERLLTQPRIILFYITLLLYPTPNRLCITHDIALSHNLINPPTTILAVSIIVVILCLALLAARRWPFLSYCVIFFFLNHLIESSIFPLELTFEHRNYIPSMLFFVPLAILIIKGIRFFSQKQGMHIIFTVFIILMLIGQGHSTYVRNMIWKNDESLWLDCIEKYPELWRPYINLGKYYSEIGQPKKAILQFEKGLQKKVINNVSDLTYWKNYFNLGVEYVRLGQREKALDYFLIVDNLFPYSPDLQNNIGALFIDERRYQEAEVRLLKALHYQPNHAKALSNLGALYLIKGKLEKAEALLDKSLAYDPYDPMTLKTYIRLLIRTGRFRDALIYAKRWEAHKRANPLFYQLLLAEIYHAIGNERQWKNIIEKLLESVDVKMLQRLIDSVLDKEKPAAILPEKAFIFSLLIELCQKKPRVYQDLESYCAQKKGDLADITRSP